MDFTHASKRTVSPTTAPVKKVVKGNAHGSIPTYGTVIVEMDPWLGPLKDDFLHPFSKANESIQKLNNHEGVLKEFSKGYEKFGINVARNATITYGEWAPNAENANFIGDFSNLVH